LHVHQSNVSIAGAQSERENVRDLPAQFPSDSPAPPMSPDDDAYPSIATDEESPDGLGTSGMCRVLIPVPIGLPLEWILQQVLLAPMIAPATGDHVLRRGYLNDIPSLRRRVLWIALGYLLVLPLLVVALLLYILVRHVGEARASGDYFGPRRWSSMALWSMREMNELPHVLERRSGAATAHATKYLGQFPNPVVASVARSIAFVAAALLVCALIPSMLSN